MAKKIDVNIVPSEEEITRLATALKTYKENFFRYMKDPDFAIHSQPWKNSIYHDIKNTLDEVLYDVFWTVGISLANSRVFNDALFPWENIYIQANNYDKKLGDVLNLFTVGQEFSFLPEEEQRRILSERQKEIMEEKDFFLQRLPEATRNKIIEVNNDPLYDALTGGTPPIYPTAEWPSKFHFTDILNEKELAISLLKERKSL